jgi:hypothetical protein
MLYYSVRVWATSIIGGSLLLALLFLLFDLEVEMIALSFSLFFFAMLLGFILSLPTLLLYVACNYYLSRHAGDPLSFRLFSTAALLLICTLEFVLIIGLPPRQLQAYTFPLLALGCYLLVAILVIFFLPIPQRSLANSKDTDKILDDELLR